MQAIEKPVVYELEAIIKVFNHYTSVLRVEDGVLKNEEHLSEEGVKQLFKYINKEDIKPLYEFSGFIPRNVLSVDNEMGKISWYTEPCKKGLIFEKTIKSTIYPIPYLLWVYDSGKINIYALKSEPKSNLDEIYSAPFFNIYRDGSVCMGNVKLKEKNTFEDIIEDTELAFFNSTFTHLNNNNIVKGNYVELMDSLKMKDSFPLDELVQIRNKKIKDVI